MRGIYGEKWGWGFASIGKVLHFVLTPSIISCFCYYTVLPTGLKRFQGWHTH
jgi:hypothetical protein